MFDKFEYQSSKTSLRRLAVLAMVFCAPAAMAGFDEGIEAHKQGQYEAALKEFQSDAMNGDPRSQYMIAEMLRKGQGIEANMERAAEWYRAAAELGHPAAQNALGTLYAMGSGVDQDDVQAYVWFSLAALLGNSVAEQNLERAKEIIGSKNKAVGDQIIKQYVPLYVLPFKPTPGFAAPDFGAPGGAD